MLHNTLVSAANGDNSVYSLDMIAPSCPASPATADANVNVALVSTKSTAHNLDPTDQNTYHYCCLLYTSPSPRD